MEILNSKLWLSAPRIVCGVMTGTSLDGIDIAIAEFRRGEKSDKFTLIAADEFPMFDEIKELIRRIVEKQADVSEISYVHYLLPRLYAESIINLTQKINLPLENIDAVGIHGQTVWHQPKPVRKDELETGSTLQLGSPSALAKLINIPVVGDFRAADIALGGEGAPLVPIFDKEFLSELDNDVIALNIGGMANITYLPAAQNKDIIAFDTGPGNILIDSAVQEYFGKKYDKDGEIAVSGKLNKVLFGELSEIEFIRRMPPKSTGRELFNLDLVKDYISKLNLNDTPKEDIIHTLTQLTGWSVAENIRTFANPKAKIIISGGGANNTFLLNLLKKELFESKIVRADESGIPSDSKEAICFAYLAYRTLGGLPGNIPSVTGAKRETVLGVIALP